MQNASRCNVPTVLVNDADAAVAAEQLVGVGKSVQVSSRAHMRARNAQATPHVRLSSLRSQDFCVMTLGSGIGVGIVLAGEIVRGATGTIEAGHMIVVPDGTLCGAFGRPHSLCLLLSPRSSSRLLLQSLSRSGHQGPATCTFTCRAPTKPPCSPHMRNHTSSMHRTAPT